MTEPIVASFTYRGDLGGLACSSFNMIRCGRATPSSSLPGTAPVGASTRRERRGVSRRILRGVVIRPSKNLLSFRPRSCPNGTMRGSWLCCAGDESLPASGRRSSHCLGEEMRGDIIRICAKISFPATISPCCAEENLLKFLRKKENTRTQIVDCLRLGCGGGSQEKV